MSWPGLLSPTAVRGTIGSGAFVLGLAAIVVMSTLGTSAIVRSLAINMEGWWDYPSSLILLGVVFTAVRGRWLLPALLVVGAALVLWGIERHTQMALSIAWTRKLGGIWLALDGRYTASGYVFETFHMLSAIFGATIALWFYRTFVPWTEARRVPAVTAPSPAAPARAR